MKNEDIYNAITEIQQKYLEEAESYKATKIFHPKRWVAIAACLCLIAIGSIGLLHKPKKLSPFVITAYAKENNGNLIANKLTSDDDIPVSVFTLNDHSYAFAFSYPNTNMNEKPHITTIYSPDYDLDENLKNITIAYSGNFISEKAGNVYIYYIFQEKTKSYELNYQTVPDKDNKKYDVSVSIYQNNGNYFAHLNSIKQSKSVNNKEDLDELLLPYQTVLDKLNAENGWNLAISENEKKSFYETYKQYSPNEFEKKIKEEFKKKTIDTLKAKYPEYFLISKYKGVEIYVWQMSEKSYRCGLLEKTEHQKTDNEILELQFKSLSVEETKLIISEIGIDSNNTIVVPISQPYSSYTYAINDEYKERVNELFK